MDPLKEYKNKKRKDKMTIKLSEITVISPTSIYAHK